MALLTSGSGTGSISSSIDVTGGGYTSPVTGDVYVRLFLGTSSGHTIAGSGSYTCSLSIKPSGSNAELFQVQPVTVASVGAVTSIAFLTIPIPCVVGDVIEINIQGLSGDTNVGWYYEIHTDTSLVNPF